MDERPKSFGLSPEEQRDLILSVGVRGDRPRNPVEVARLFDKMIRNGASRADCANLVHLNGTTMVGRFLRLLSLDPDVEVGVGWRASPATIIFTVASELARLDRADQMIVCRAAIENAMPIEEIKEVVRLRRMGGKSLEDCIQQILQLRPHVERRYMFVGRIEDDVLLQSLKGMSQGERDLLIKNALVTIDRTLRDASAKLTRDRFSIVGGERTTEVLSRQKPDFESVINDALKAALKGW